ncbi:hypothetical protein AWB67_04748 [Caballeronia terrestris]|uniref:Lipoprotein n=1 Tax=Caballeronia terrestris TaxID=1226301 RepID=A0A158K3R4_9BURK|nr:hypothetical protein [Caballeronia terrestris]SAL75369.1 hypothetical protein AWB67_04748 [Caballeronia terrestris]
MNRRLFLATKFALLLALAAFTNFVSAHDRWDDGNDQGGGSRALQGRHEKVSPKARLYDARGTVIGDVIYVGGIDYDGGVLLNFSGVLVFAGFSRAGGYQTNDALSNSEFVWQYPQLAYSNPNCTGTPYIYYDGGPYRPSAIERKGNTATLYIAKDTLSQTVTMGSSIGGYGSCYAGAPVYVSKAWSVESTVDLTQLFPEPLRIGR